MARIDFPPVQEMSPQARAVYEEAAAGPRGHAPAPMAGWLPNPELARRAQKLGEFVRFEIDLPSRLRELAVLVIARHWSAHHEWRIHKRDALKQGVSAEVVADIANRRRPSFTSDADRVVYDIVTSIVDTRKLSDDLYRSGVALLGDRGMAEVVAVIGYYTFVSITLTTFQIGMDDRQPELDQGTP